MFLMFSFTMLVISATFHMPLPIYEHFLKSILFSHFRDNFQVCYKVKPPVGLTSYSKVSPFSMHRHYIYITYAYYKTIVYIAIVLSMTQ